MPINPAEISTIRVGELPIDEILLTSKFPIENDTTLYQATLQDLINFININASALQYEVKELWVNQTYIDNNFDVTGFGINLMEGYAICNGNNGTPPMDGLVSVAYGTNYNVIGGFGGEDEHQLVADEIPILDLTITASTDDSTEGDPDFFLMSDRASVGQVTIPASVNTTSSTDPHNNMQPYIILLKIMKL
jgi:hypothetical protein